jgi:hypothetical protein
MAKGLGKLLGPGHFGVQKRHTQSPSRGLCVYPRWALPVLLSRDVGHPCDPGDRFPEQLESLTDDLRTASGAQPSEVAAGTAEAADQPRADRIGHACEDDWNRASRLLRSLDGWWA